MSKKPTFGLIVANRGFFPDKLCEEGRKSILKVLGKEDIDVITLSSQDTKFASVESLQDARKCAELFKKHREEIDGIVVTLPNFGDEKGVANTLRFSGLDVPLLVQAFPDDIASMSCADRRDSFCGKMSTCNNLNQYGIKYSLTNLHTVHPEDASFKADLLKFKQICQVVQGLKKLRVGVIGARPAAFNTVRFSEKILERTGISVETIDLSEVFGAANKLANTDKLLKAKLDEIKSYITIKDIPNEALERMARFGVVVDNWMGDNDLQASAIQCWTSMEQYFGAVPCTLMSIMSNKLIPSACETDVGGVIAMYAMVLASGKPSAIVDWNNNYGQDSDKCVIFHCSNFPKEVFIDPDHISNCRNCSKENLPIMDFQEIIASDVGKENAYGTIVGRIKPGPFTFCRVATEDFSGKITTYLGQGELTDDPLQTFGGFGVAHIPKLQDLLQYICDKGFEHHVAINRSQSASVLKEAFEKYLDWDVYFHDNVFD